MISSDFVSRYNDDDSELSETCSTWGQGHNGKWSGAYKNERLGNHPMFVPGKYHWILIDKTRYECDNFQVQPKVGDFWKVYVR